MINNKDALYRYLMDSYPTFKGQWESEDNYFINEDGSFTDAGLCAEFSHFFIEKFVEIDEESRKVLFDNIEIVLVEAEKNGAFSDIANSMKSCFVENIAQTEAGEVCKELMGGLTRAFFDEWHVYP